MVDVDSEVLVTWLYKTSGPCGGSIRGVLKENDPKSSKMTKMVKENAKNRKFGLFLANFGEGKWTF